MRVFISWSGEFSHDLADAFRLWLPGTLQMVKPYFTPKDVEKGTKWTSEISKELKDSNLGVLFLTRENVGSSWLLYEAGALSKELATARVCPLIFGMTPGDLPAPLRQHQATEFRKDDYLKLLRTVNNAAGDARLEDNVLDGVFETWWPGLKEQFDEIISRYGDVQPTKPLRADREILEEILGLVRLDVERKRIQDPIHPGAVRALMRALVDATKSANDTAVVSALHETLRPMEYIVSKIDADDEINGLWRELRSLSFEPTVQEEDDIPF